ncbi:MAG: circularly permuted type 2 ATP-grasp protein [Gammaproteobacteria bacterium]|jgi:uncharacterized circularly permuted ATP-grasp superfamily protein/uncharacterized alpha-E superfamily protein
MPGQLVFGYNVAPGVYDELLEPNGCIRPMWQPVIAAFENMSEADREAARNALSRTLSENRVTFVTEDDAAATQQPWQLDLLPMLISPKEWSSLERGLIQRAQLLNTLLADLYGEQRVLRDGHLPPSVVFSNPRYLPPCANIPMRGGRHLHFMAFDCARSPDGQWWILSDRADAPSGAGYALENRITTSRVLPELFAGQNVRRHAGFFRDFNEYFLSLSSRDEPLAVCLSHGRSQRTYFEHSYLARYLGYSVVEGSDLAVRDDRLFLKTVDGLRPVDVLLRNIRSENCDPLELRSDSMIGVPGLLQAVRAGKVTIGNALGSGLIESDALLSFLPALSKYFLGEELQLPSVATWWCGQAPERDYVIEHLDELVVRRISNEKSVLTGDYDLRIGADLSHADRDWLINELGTGGHDFVGQEALKLSTAPVWSAEGGLRPAPVLLRMFVASTEEGYAVLPGGLTRVAIDSDPAAAWLSAGDVSKDTWVLSDEPVEHFSLLAQRQDAVWLRRGTRDLPSRAADHLFWLGRYAERAEAAVRLLRSLIVRLHGDASVGHSDVPPERIVSLLVSQKHLAARRGRRVIQAGQDALEQELWTIIFDEESNDGLAAVIANVRRTAEVVRERLSFDAFGVLMNLADAPRRRMEMPANEFSAALEVLDRLIRYLAAFSGMVMENMTRGVGWRFLDIGRRIERVRTMTQLTQQLTARGDPRADGTLDLLLELADSTMTYLGRYHAQPQLARVLDLLLVDETNPRSLAFQMATIDKHLSKLSRSSDDGILGPDMRITTDLLSRLRLADVVDLADSVSRFGTRVGLDRLCRDTEKGIDSLSDHITRQYFSHATPRRVVTHDRRKVPR